MNAITIRQAQKNLKFVLDQVISNAEPTIICADNGEKAVLMSLDEFSSWQETLYLLSNPANAEHLMNSIEEIKVGKFSEQELIEQ